jgi:F-box domain
MAIDVDMNVEEVHQCATESYSFSDDFWMAIFTHLDAASLCVVAQTCYGLYMLAEDKLLWYIRQTDIISTNVVQAQPPTKKQEESDMCPQRHSAPS